MFSAVSHLKISPECMPHMLFASLCTQLSPRKASWPSNTGRPTQPSYNHQLLTIKRAWKVLEKSSLPYISHNAMLKIFLAVCTINSARKRTKIYFSKMDLNHQSMLFVWWMKQKALLIVIIYVDLFQFKFAKNQTKKIFFLQKLFSPKESIEGKKSIQKWY